MALSQPQTAAPPLLPARTLQALPADDVYSALESRPAGLTAAEAAERLQRFGPNVLQEDTRKSLVLEFVANFTHLMALLLWAGGLIALFSQSLALALSIWMVNIINGVFSFWQEYKAEKATEALRKMLPETARVLRDGQELRLPAEALVPGDVLLLAEGDHVSADGRLVEAHALCIDQSTLSGESRPVRKSREAVTSTDTRATDLPNQVFAGTNVEMGTGTAVVSATGMATAFGSIAYLTQHVEEVKSPLQRELDHTTRAVTVIAICCGVSFFLLAVTLAGIQPGTAFVFALGMIVAYVPEGLLPTVTLTLALGVQRMAKRHALIKRLSAVETLGCASVICTDKTGTLTQNAMTVTALWTGGRAYAVSGVGYAPDGAITDENGNALAPAGDLKHLLLAGAFCSNARLLQPNAEFPEWRVAGDPTEGALLVAASKGKLDLRDELMCTPRISEIPFDAHRKRMSTIHRDASQVVAYVKGAPRELLEHCTSVEWGGVRRPLTAKERAKVIAANDAYASDGLRVLGVAWRTVPADCTEHTPEVVERDLTFIGLAAMMDPPRPEVAQAVDRCHSAGIRVVMITGDYGLTAQSVAQRVGIVRTGTARVLSGAELDALSDEALRKALDGDVIFARVAPEHKQRIVAAYQAQGHVVAVTGDGVNDAPALKKADIGVAMGLAGTDVAKEAADMVLTDDNFASIVNAVEEGRAVFHNVRKFVTYLFTCNFAEGVPFILFALSGGHIPLALTIMEILSLDLGAEIVPALALGADPPASGAMERPPRSLGSHLVSRALLVRAFGFLGPIESVAAMAAFYFQYWTHGYMGALAFLPSTGVLYSSATAMTLACIVTTQIGNMFALRAEHGQPFGPSLRTNRLVGIGVFAALAVVSAVIYLPLLQRIFGTTAFPARNWLFLFACAPLLLLADAIRRAVLKRVSGR